ncbi:DUF1848 domain-containing protein [Prosthecochloris sp. HL-130-GSB]|jgi:hypothetical protein|uniref:DUF1848 domain-containing protein n=1 Tax=Prosthecochloris aestuarii TaxID=1102 RepID=A0A831SR20_PROAE|nr:DUF1848 domain-containing protein [Prosthecochloris sp. HL-130-GSB]ARM31476.1 hypothetical protein B9H02_09425 [Prosthecochloris sp. HL-130-GSB]MBO8092854.1 DUF1848 domain-containing protein [Prosthecochloris sp.]HED30630.1 DUF1848 domain-containing protein [Prosthecochloris aestuarii]
MALFDGFDGQVVSASRRTDIPAFYSQWFMHRVEAGYCRVANPLFPSQVRTVSLRPEDVAAFVFWSRYTRPLHPGLEQLARRGYRYLFLYTLTGYPAAIEPGLGDPGRQIEDFLALSRLAGSGRVIWRYDPVLLSPVTGLEWHRKNFEFLASRLAEGTDTVIITFLQVYRHLHTALDQESIRAPMPGEWLQLAVDFREIAQRYGIGVKSCGLRPGADLFEQGTCIDHRMLRKLFGLELPAGKDPGQPEVCLCIKSTDIGAYESCQHGCRYCYATRDFSRARRFFAKHDTLADMLSMQ